MSEFSEDLHVGNGPDFFRDYYAGQETQRKLTLSEQLLAATGDNLRTVYQMPGGRETHHDAAISTLKRFLDTHPVENVDVILHSLGKVLRLLISMPPGASSAEFDRLIRDETTQLLTASAITKTTPNQQSISS